MHKVGQIINIDGKGGFKIVDSPSGCQGCECINNNITEEPCLTCADICREMGRSNIKLTKVVDDNNLDEYLKFQNECGNLDN